MFANDQIKKEMTIQLLFGCLLCLLLRFRYGSVVFIGTPDKTTFCPNKASTSEVIVAVRNCDTASVFSLTCFFALLLSLRYLVSIKKINK
jgi:hypothetical protein